MKRRLLFVTVASGFVTLLGLTAAQAQPVTTTPTAAVVTTGYANAKPVVTTHTVAARVAFITVHSGDTLSSIAQSTWHSAGDWPALWWANKNEVPHPNSIRIGQELRVPASVIVTAAVYRTALSRAAPTRHHYAVHVTVHTDSSGRIWGVTFGFPNKCGDGDGDGWDTPCWKLFGHHSTAPTTTTTEAQPVSSAPSTTPQRVSYSGGSAFQQCVMKAESGGDPNAVNPSTGAAGLYGFLPSTWHALGYGGLPQDASVATQNAAFAAEYARAGSSPWAPYDGC